MTYGCWIWRATRGPRRATRALCQTRNMGHRGIFFGSNYIYVTHGFAKKRFSDTYRYDLVNNIWSKVHDSISVFDRSGPHARCLHAGTMVSSAQMILFGGCLSGGKTVGPCPSWDSWRYSGGWSQFPFANQPVPRLYAAMAPLPGGYAGMFTGSVDKTGKQWMGGDKVKGNAFDVVQWASTDNDWSRRTVGGALPALDQAAVAIIPYTSSGADQGTASQILLHGGRKNFAPPSSELFTMNVTSVSDITSTGETVGAATFFVTPMLHGIFMFLG